MASGILVAFGFACRKCSVLLSNGQPRASRTSTSLLAAMFLLPVVSALASYTGYRSLLLFVFFSIACAVFLVFLGSGSSVHEGMLVALIFCLSLSLLLSSSLISVNLVGWDIHEEYRIFLSVAKTGYWHPDVESSYSSCLSISITPAVLSAVSAVDGIVIFKLVFPILFSTVPVILYRVFRNVLAPRGAFVSAFLFIAYPAFYQELIALGRQEVAELLFAPLLLIFISPKLSRERPTKILALLLCFGLVTAHYSMAWIFLLVLWFSFLISRISRRALPLISPGSALLSTMVALVWQLIIAGSIVLIYSSEFVSTVLRGVVQDFFNPATRLLGVQAFGGAGGVLTEANRIVQWLVQLSLALGFLWLARKRKGSLPERRMLGLVSFGLAMIASVVIVPYFAAGLTITRTYQIALLLVSALFVYGTDLIGSALRRAYSFVLKNASVRRATSLPNFGPHMAATILFLYFLFTSGWVSAVSLQRPFSFVLDRERMATYPDSSLKEYYYSYVTSFRDIASARWLRSHFAVGDAICGDVDSKLHVLSSYGEFFQDGSMLPSECDFGRSYVYLSEENTLGGIGLGYDVKGLPYVWSVSNISMQLGAKNRIYSTDAGIIYG